MSIKKVAILIKRAALEFDKISNPYFSEYDLTVSQYRILKFLYAQSSRTARIVDIEKNYSLTHPTTIGLIENLESKGFVVRTDNPNNARSRLIALTSKSDEMQTELEQLGDKLESKMTERLTEAERAQLVALLQKLIGLDG